MTNRSEEGIPHVWLGFLASSICAGSLNLAASVLDRPRAFESPGQLALPLALGVLAFGAAFAVSSRLLRPLRLPDPVRATALGAGWTAVAVLLPLAEVLQRSLSPYHRPALWVICTTAVLAVAVCGGFVAARFPRSPRGGFVVLFAPFAALELLVLFWLAKYRAIGVVVLPLSAGLAVGTWLALVWLRRGYGPVTPLASLLAWIGIAAAATAGFESEPPHEAAGSVAGPSPIVLLTVDTLRPDHLSFFEPEAGPTPAIDRLLEESVVFTNARSAAPWTKPALASILTGLSPRVHGTTTRRARLPEGARTLAERFQEAGYVTGGVGLNVHLEDAFRFGQGFDEYRFPALPEYGISVGARLLEAWRPDRYPELFPSTRAITDVALDWVERHADAPFFLWVHYLDPHWPYEPPPEHVDEALRDHRLFWGDHQTVTAVQAGNLKLGRADRDYVRMLYDGEIRYTDHELGRLLDGLRERGLYERALIAFASDHGEEFWEHGSFEHGHTLYDEVLRVPLAFKLPGSRVRRRSDVAVSTVSLAPTLVDVAGLASDADGFSAPSLLPCFEGDPDGPTLASFATGTYYHGQKEMVVFGEGRWKYVHELDTGREALFDLAEDPAELRSVAPLHADLLEEARRRLEKRREEALELRRLLGIAVDETRLDPALETRLQAIGYLGEGK